MIGQDRQRLIAEAGKRSGVPIHPLRLVSELQKILTPDVTVCSDMGSFSIYLSRYLFSFRARQFLITNGQQTLGSLYHGPSLPPLFVRMKRCSRFLARRLLILLRDEMENGGASEFPSCSYDLDRRPLRYGRHTGTIELRTHFRSRFWSGRLREVRPKRSARPHSKSMAQIKSRQR